MKILIYSPSCLSKYGFVLEHKRRNLENCGYYKIQWGLVLFYTPVTFIECTNTVKTFYKISSFVLCKRKNVICNQKSFLSALFNSAFICYMQEIGVHILLFSRNVKCLCCEFSKMWWRQLGWLKRKAEFLNLTAVCLGATCCKHVTF